ncbi:hypothetical protein LC653_03920 [Nostoc sp. CHAB 5784]|uniref:hypothetical protein n=1 Tax=Nostoc mirabile TaxID=2907820 RepID=UPI001E386D77|nr:hypothetical protein [Nostoc mirabile]MCC5663104.1 hypothetical protein [Nostoc mirabile CHAB5784]
MTLPLPQSNIAHFSEERLSKTCWNSAVEGIAMTKAVRFATIVFSIQNKRSRY